jgi:hypothetical protein
MGGVPIEEYVFYFTGFLAVLLIYIWLDEFWLSAYHIREDAEERRQFEKLLQFHPLSLIACIILIAFVIVLRHLLMPHSPGFPGYAIFLILIALAPSTVLLPAARPVINWRALSLTLFIIALTSMLWEATLALPYGWWNFQPAQMVGLPIIAWDSLPIEEVFVWIAVTYVTVVTYEIVKRWKSSGRPMKHAFWGS